MVPVNVNKIYSSLSIAHTTLLGTAKKPCRLETLVECHDNIPREADDTRDEYVGERTVRHKTCSEELKI